MEAVVTVEFAELLSVGFGTDGTRQRCFRGVGQEDS